MRAFSRKAVRFWSILGTNKIGVVFFPSLSSFFNILITFCSFVVAWDRHMGVERNGIGSV